jgi:hypothetical protein
MMVRENSLKRLKKFQMRSGRKLRFTLFLVTGAQVTFGSDSYSIRTGKNGIGKAYITHPEPALVFANEDPVAAEAFALSLLKDLKTTVPPGCQD